MVIAWLLGFSFTYSVRLGAMYGLMGWCAMRICIYFTPSVDARWHIIRIFSRRISTTSRERCFVMTYQAIAHRPLRISLCAYAMTGRAPMITDILMIVAAPATASAPSHMAAAATITIPFTHTPHACHDDTYQAMLPKCLKASPLQYFWPITRTRSRGALASQPTTGSPCFLLRGFADFRLAAAAAVFARRMMLATFDARRRTASIDCLRCVEDLWDFAWYYVIATCCAGPAMLSRRKLLCLPFSPPYTQRCISPFIVCR